MSELPGRVRQAEVFLGGVRGRRPVVPVDPGRLEAAARRAMSDEAFAYFAGGAGSERTVAANRAGLERLRIVPRVLRDVSRRSLSVELFGRTLPTPFLLAPIGVLELARPRGDLLAARAAAAEGVPIVFSSQASVPLEDCVASMGAASRWFQLYPSSSDEIVASFVQRAESCGCDTLVVTLDTTMLGWRPRDLDRGYLPFLLGKGIAQYTSDPVFQRLLDERPGDPSPAGRITPAAVRALVQLARGYPGSFWSNLASGRPQAAVRLFLDVFSRPSLSWDDLARLRGSTRLPILVKGVLHPDDARAAVAHEVDGIVVSNHGGRQVDGAIGAIDVLPAIVDAVGGRVPVLFDGGIRSGADAFKALALGARAVLIGRPYAYALSLAGEAGVRELIRNLVAELDLTMGLAGCATIGEIGPESLGAAPA